MANVLIDDKLLREPNLATPNKKPVGNVELDWNHPLAKHVKYFVIDGDGLDIASRTLFPNIKRTMELAENSFNNLGGSGGNFTPQITGAVTSGTHITRTMWLTGAPDWSSSVSWGHYIDSSNNTDVGPTYVSGTVRYLARQNSGVSNAVQSINMNRFYTYAGVWDSNTGIQNCLVYVDGKYVTTGPWSGASPRYNVPTIFARFGGNDYTVTDYQLMLDKKLTASEIKSLYDNPYQLLKPAGSAKQLNFISQVTTTEEVLVDNVILREPNLATTAKKPVGNVEIDWDHPLADGLVTYLLLGRKDINHIEDIVKNGANRFTRNASTEDPSIGKDNYGNPTLNLTRIITTPIQYSATNDNMVGATSGTIVSDVKYDGVYDNVRIYGIGSGWGESYNGFSIRFSPTIVDVTAFSDAYFGVWNRYAHSSHNKWYQYASVWNGGNDLVAYRDGIALTLSSAPANNETTSLYGTSEAVGKSTTYSGGLELNYVMIYRDRALTTGELDELRRDPYQILKPAGSAKQINRINFQYTPEEVLVDDAILREPNLLTPAKKPVGNVEIDWEHPTSKDLKVLFLLNKAGDARNEVDGIEVPRISSQYMDIDVGGLSSRTTADKQFFKSVYNPLPVSFDDFSILIRGNVASSTTKMMSFMSWNTSPPNESYRMYFNAYYAQNAQASTVSAGTVYFGGYSTANNSRGTWATNVLKGVPQTFIGVRKSGVWYLYGDGRLLSSSDQSANPVDVSSTYCSLSIGGFASLTTVPFTRPLYLCCGWARALNDGEAKSLSLDPYQILKPAGSMPEIVRITAYSGEEPEPPVGHPSVPWMSFF
jgi:hypothetical protein